MAGHLREALTDDDLDEQSVSNTSGWADSAASVAAPAGAPLTPPSTSTSPLARW